MNLMNTDFSNEGGSAIMSANGQQPQQQHLNQMPPQQQQLQQQAPQQQFYPQNQNTSTPYASPDYPEFDPNQQQMTMSMGQQQFPQQPSQMGNYQPQYGQQTAPIAPAAAQYHGSAPVTHPSVTHQVIASQATASFGRDDQNIQQQDKLMERPETTAPRESRMRESRMSSIAITNRNRRHSNRKMIMRDYQKKPRKSSQMAIRYGGMRPAAQSELGAPQTHSQADRLVSEMTSLKINTTSRSRNRGRPTNVQSQPSAIVEPTRTREILERKVKRTQAGALGIAALGQRTTGEVAVAEKKKADSVEVAKKVDADEIDPKDPYEKIRIDKNQNNDDIVCDVCLDDDDDDNNEIVICDLCLGAVHQRCYGSELLESIPEGNWYCARCRDLMSQPSKKCTEIKCVFCPKIDGILKPIATSGNKNLWAHPICVNWLQGIWYKDDRQEQVEGKIHPDLMKIPCTLCHKVCEGAVIQCEFQSCKVSRHVRCAAQGGWIYNWDQMADDLQVLNDDMAKPVFCEKHRERGIFTYKIRGMDGLQKKSCSKKAATTQVSKFAKATKPVTLIEMGSSVNKVISQIAMAKSSVPKSKASKRIQKVNSRSRAARAKKRAPIQSSFRRESSIVPAPMPRGTSRVSVIQQKKAAAKKQVISSKKSGQGIHGKAKQAKLAKQASQQASSQPAAMVDPSMVANQMQMMSQMMMRMQQFQQMQQQNGYQQQAQQNITMTPSQVTAQIQKPQSRSKRSTSKPKQTKSSRQAKAQQITSQKPPQQMSAAVYGNKPLKVHAKQIVKDQSFSHDNTTPPSSPPLAAAYNNQQMHSQIQQQQMPHQSYHPQQQAQQNHYMHQNQPSTGHYQQSHQQYVAGTTPQQVFQGQVQGRVGSGNVGSGKAFNFANQQWA